MLTLSLHMYIYESMTLIGKWASTNEIPIIYIDEYYHHEDNGTLPQEFLLKEWGALIHYITPFHYFEGNTTLTEEDRQTITRIVGLYEIQGIGLPEPPKVTPYLEFLRSGEASMHKNAYKLHVMMETLYAHYSYWALLTNAEHWSMKEKDTSINTSMEDLNRLEVDRALTWMREVYFKKDWSVTEGPLLVYIQ